jgi:serine protease Do
MKRFHNSICRRSNPINLLVLSAGLFLVPLSLRAQTVSPSVSQTRHSVLDGSADSLQQVSTSLQTLSNQVSPSVVQIFNAAYTSDGDRQNGNADTSSRRSTSGSGVILGSDGWIVTNAHVVQGSRRIRVRLNSGLDSSGEQNAKSRRPLLDAKVIVADRETDLALLKIEADRLPVLELADSSDLKQGQLVLAFGSPLGLDNSVSLGIVSSVARQLDPDSPTIYVQTDAAINPGNSGGPLVDTNGRVVGINTFILTQSGGNEGIGLAIPSNVVRSVYNDVRSEGHVHHHQIGVSARTVTPALASALGLNRQDGVLIEDVNLGGPASSAGLMPGDIILSVNERPVHDIREFALGLYSFAVGEKAKLDVQRDSKILSYQVPVAERQDLQGRLADVVAREQINIPQLGILVLTLDDKLRDMLPPLRHRLGVVVTGRLSEGSYSGEQPLPGDVIYSVNGAPVDGVDSLRSVLETLQNVDAIALQVERLGTLHYLLLNADQ